MSSRSIIQERISVIRDEITDWALCQQNILEQLSLIEAHMEADKSFTGQEKADTLNAEERVRTALQDRIKRPIFLELCDWAQQKHGYSFKKDGNINKYLLEQDLPKEELLELAGILGVKYAKTD